MSAGEIPEEVRAYRGDSLIVATKYGALSTEIQVSLPTTNTLADGGVRDTSEGCGLAFAKVFWSFCRIGTMEKTCLSESRSPWDNHCSKRYLALSKPGNY